MMRLNLNILKPFSIVYKKVTVFVKSASNQQVQPYNLWLNYLIKNFHKEYEKWEEEKFNRYFAKLDAGTSRVVCLAACAYFHIAYDLPRVLADAWGDPSFKAIDAAMAEDIYFAMDEDFRRVLESTASDENVTGGWHICATALEFSGYSDVIGGLSIWVQLLRAGAWRHGKRLGDMVPTIRTDTESRILAAMCDALKDVMENQPQGRPWKLGELRPPNAAFSIIHAFFLLPLLAIDMPLIQVVLSGTTLITLLAYGIWRIIASRKRALDLQEMEEKYQDQKEFMSALGERIYDYVRVVFEPETDYDMYRKSRQNENEAEDPNPEQ